MTDDRPQIAQPVGPPNGRAKFGPLSIAIKTAISLGLIGFVFWKIDLASVWEKLRHISATLMAAVILLFLIQVFVAALRWWIILRHQRLAIGLLEATRICLIGAFFNQLLPSSIGGDVARAWCVYRNGYGKGIAATTVLSDRIYGMLSLVGFAIVCFPILIHFSIDRHALIAVAFLVLAATAALAAAFWIDHSPAWMRRWALIRHLGTVSEATRAVTADRKSIAPLLGLSSLVHLLTILAILALLAGVMQNPNLLLCGALIPVITLVAMAPVSIAGWGVRESVMISGLGLAHVPPEAALIVSILMGLSLTAVGVIGGLAWLAQISRDRSVLPVHQPPA